MPTAARQFEDKPAVRERVPLLLGLVGPSSSGKTFSALRLATGMQRVYGGDIFGVDTESSRMLHYEGMFKFRHVPFAAPFGPLDYLAAIEHCITRGAKVIVIDSMTHEHSGAGGVMDQVEAILDEKCGDDYAKRERMGAAAHVRPKAQRRKLNNAIVQLGARAAFIFCYRAQYKEYPRKLGWTPETTSTLHYEMAQRFLLPPGSVGVPKLNPETEAEKLLVKTQAQFSSFFKAGEPLNEDIGYRFAEWAAGSPATGAALKSKVLLDKYAVCESRELFDALEAERRDQWKAFKAAEQKALKAASEAANKRIAERPVSPPTTVGEPDGHLFGIGDPALDAQAR